MRSLGLTIAAAGLSAVLSGCGKSPSEDAAHGSATPPPAPPTAAEKQARLAALPAPYNAADLTNGESKFALCRSCHTITPGGPNTTGPNLYGTFNHKAAFHPGFNYSEPLKASGITWDPDHLDRWLQEPRALVPGTKMSFAGLKDAKDRTDLIAYLAVEAGSAP